MADRSGKLEQSGAGRGWCPKRLRDPALFRCSAFIDGRWMEAREDRLPVRNPADGRELGSVPNLGEAGTNQAIEAAERAYPGWRKTSASERASILRAWGEAMLASIDDLAAILTAEQGKPLTDARGEIRYAASFVQWFAEECRRSYGETVPSPWADKRILVTKEPVGVVGAITPWNFPSAMVTRKAVPAIAAGCTVVLKPSEQTPFSALALAVLAERVGLPAGVINVVTGEPQPIGAALCASPVVRKLTFTGSTRVGRVLAAQCAPTIKKLSLELGGNAPFIVFEDADLDAAVAGALASKYRNAGQTCVCTNRFLVQESVHDAFVERLAAASAQLRVGDGFTEGVEQGPLINPAAVERLGRLIGDALADGASLVSGGGSPGGCFFEPTVVTGVRPEMGLAREEIFGPVAAIASFDTEEEAVAIANATEYGLAAYFYTRDLARTWRVMEALEYGIVGVNSGIVSTEVAPFGGMKQSGLGREGGKAGLNEFLETKMVCIGGL